MKNLLSGGLAVALLAGAAFGQLATDIGSIDGSEATYNRALEGFSGLSGVGTNVFFDVRPFYVNTTGTYDILSTQTDDGFLFVYAGSFNPANPTANGIGSDDDGSGGIGTSDVVGLNLTANTQYYAVTTTFDNGVTMDYRNDYYGPQGASVIFGNIPAPASVALLGLGGLVAGRRRR
ncbi:MAG: PEP-CTERM sorting domain-containing protein [Phycisphaerales bacterium]|jgi:hypothetical protein|nr:PEP-CTERM sorting domain-containing protein [Phycisphaerales bacterium]